MLRGAYGCVHRRRMYGEYNFFMAPLFIEEYKALQRTLKFGKVRGCQVPFVNFHFS